MKNAIIELLNKADENKLKLVYYHTKSLLGGDVNNKRVISIVDGYLALDENSIIHITDEELEQVRTICKNIKERTKGVEKNED